MRDDHNPSPFVASLYLHFLTAPKTKSKFQMCLNFETNIVSGPNLLWIFSFWAKKKPYYGNKLFNFVWHPKWEKTTLTIQITFVFCFFLLPLSLHYLYFLIFKTFSCKRTFRCRIRYFSICKMFCEYVLNLIHIEMVLIHIEHLYYLNITFVHIICAAHQ